jgi:multiple sugar transport system permease protein
MPGITVATIATFIGVYAGQFVFALTFNSKSEFAPLTTGLFAFFGRREVLERVDGGELRRHLASAVDHHFLQRYLVAGLTAGAVKE